MMRGRTVAFLVVTGWLAGACRQPSSPPIVPPPHPLDPTSTLAQSSRDDTLDAAIAPEVTPSLDAATLGFDAGVPQRR
jgi:hypothetical protein